MGGAPGHDDPRCPVRGEGRWRPSRVAATISPSCFWRRQQATKKILFRLIDDGDIPDDGLGFHAQQAVEKMIKAVLAHNEVSYERTHNIAYLLKLLDAAGIPRPDGADDLPNLSPWAAELRYGRQPDAAPDRGQMRTLVEQTKAWADRQLKGVYDDPFRPDSSAG